MRIPEGSGTSDSALVPPTSGGRRKWPPARSPRGPGQAVATPSPAPEACGSSEPLRPRVCTCVHAHGRTCTRGHARETGRAVLGGAGRRGETSRCGRRPFGNGLQSRVNPAAVGMAAGVGRAAQRHPPGPTTRQGLPRAGASFPTGSCGRCTHLAPGASRQDWRPKGLGILRAGSPGLAGTSRLLGRVGARPAGGEVGAGCDCTLVITEWPPLSSPNCSWLT